MGFKKAILVLLLLIILTMGAASAVDTNTTSDNLAANEDTSVKLSENNDFEDKLGIESSNHISDTGNSTGKLTDLENVMSLTKDNHKEDKSYDDILSAQNDLNVLNTNNGTYSGLATEIGSGGNIELNCDYYTYDSGDTITISTPNSVINGKGAIIDMAGSPSMRAFEVTASGVTIKNLTIKNTNYTGDGGAIYFSNSGTVTNCNFTNNSASVYGGAISMNSGTVSNCNFTNNTASSGGAVYFEVGTVINCNFTDNTASVFGGAIMGSGNVTNCNFTNNKAFGGGAIMGSGNVTNCNFINNSASESGGVVLMSSGSVENCNFTNNNVSGNGSAIMMVSGNVTNCNFINNSASESGGAVYFLGEGSVANCNFINNTADYVGAVYFNSTGNVTNCNFNNNNAYYGGAVYFLGEGSVANCNFTDNQASHYGGAVYFNGDGDVRNCNFDNNTARSGGAVYFEVGTVINCNFTNNSASEFGGAVYIRSNGTVTNCNFTNNKAIEYNGRGGAVYFPNNANGNVINCNFSANTATADGGAIRMSSGSVENCNFTGNTATGTYSQGGAIWMSFASVENCNFTNNQATRYGGAIWMYSATVSNCNFTGNTATGTYSQGGAVYFYSDCDVRNCNFTDNQATGYGSKGGAVYFEGTGTVSNCNFTDNKANGTYSYGGAIRMYSGTVSNCNFTGNKATGSSSCGGAISMNSGTVSNCNFTDNEATESGGAVYFSSNGTVTNCNFADNQASHYGGAIGFNGEGNVINCNFTNNSASESGGAVDFSSNGTVTNCNFTNNSASGVGGAIFFYSDSKGNVTKCNFINCSAELGKAIYANSNTLISSCNFETQGSERLSELVMGGIISNCTVNGKKEKTATNMTIITEDITYGENATITVTMTTDGTVTVNINNQNIGLEITNGTGQITIPNLNVGEYIVKASFEGNSDYESANATTTLTVKSNMKTFEDITSLIGSAYAGDIINLEGTYYGTGLIITVNKELTISGDGETILDAKNLSGILSISANNVKISNIRFINGKINANGGAINWIGKNGMISNCTFINCSAENGGSVYWNGENGMINKSTFDKSTATSNGGAIYWNANSGEIANSIFTNSHAQNGGAVYVPENMNVEIKSSIFDSNIAEEESGAVYGGTVDDDCTFKNNTYTPVNTKTFISINETAVYVGNDILITTLILNNDKGVLVNTGTVEIYINSKLIATIPANTQYIHTTGEIGKYQVLAKFIDDSTYNGSSSTAEFTVIPVDIPEEIETSNEGIFTLEFPDDAEGTLTVFIDGVKYKVYDIIGGILKIDLSDKKGKYNITFEYSGDKNYPAFKKDANVTVETNPSITASNAKVLYSAGTTYKITVYKNKGITANGVNVVIKQNNKKFKTIKTNSKGIASFKVTQTPGTYKLKITSLGKTVTKTLTVKHIVTLKTATVKKSAKKLILQATLAKVNKKYLKKKTVTFKFNGKKYKAKTNSKGVAKVTIKSNVLKKLKVGKKLTYQATYLKDTVKKTTKVKK